MKNKIPTFDEFNNDINESFRGKRIKDDYTLNIDGLEINLKNYFRFHDDEQNAMEMAKHVYYNVPTTALESYLSKSPSEIIYISIGIGAK